MMIDRTNGTHAVSTANYAGALTPDALLSYCSARMNDLDFRIDTFMKKQEGARGASEKLTKFQSTFSGGASTKGIGSLEKCGELPFTGADMRAAREALPEAQRATFDAIVKDYEHTAADGYLDANECKAFAERLGALSKDISSSAELDMIQLQSLMSQRQMAVQLCTNLMQSLNDTTKAIAQKIGS